MKQIFLALCLLFAVNVNILIAETQEEIEFDDEELNSEMEDLANSISSTITQQSAEAFGSGCFCGAQIPAFTLFAADLIQNELKDQEISLKKLKTAAKQHKNTMNEQNNQLNNKLNLLKEESLRNRELLFYLKQKVNLQ